MQKKNAAGKSSAKEDSDDDAEDDFERQVVSFLQVALERPETAAARKKVIGFLSRQATKIDSVVLSAAEGWLCGTLSRDPVFQVSKSILMQAHDLA